MKILSWNCRGLGNPRTVQDLCLIVKEKKPNIVFLMETKLISVKTEWLKSRVGFQNCFVVDPMGLGGGLILFWDMEVELEVYNYSQRHINSWITDRDSKFSWLLTGFYGHPEVHKRQETWRMLESFKPSKEEGWCVLGDFNEIVMDAEKEGGRPRKESQMDSFREALEVCELHDVGWRGNRFTWSNKHSDETFTKERLDRAVVNSSWNDTYAGRELEILVSRCSDHKPILLCCKKPTSLERLNSMGFKYEASWALEEGCRNVIEAEWKKGVEMRNTGLRIQSLLEKCSVALRKWNRHLIKDRGKAILEKTASLKQL
ncbi:uncharacterized protein LOC122306435 [Carya illinoinensis]|uniref:uncharacterized protein LOC122306435 n=1 Tax=Carya illinoinensis TaxID=32201 RepID=UPI001C71F995|nr:uncharacterized protein LOC122306435 [Carya illinoinensis]